MIAAGSTEIHNQNEVKAIQLIESAATHCTVIGAPSRRWLAPPFSVREKLDGGGIVWSHSRCQDYENRKVPASENAVSSTLD